MNADWGCVFIFICRPSQMQTIRLEFEKEKISESDKAAWKTLWHLG